MVGVRIRIQPRPFRRPQQRPFLQLKSRLPVFQRRAVALHKILVGIRGMELHQRNPAVGISIGIAAGQEPGQFPGHESLAGTRRPLENNLLLFGQQVVDFLQERDIVQVQAVGEGLQARHWWRWLRDFSAGVKNFHNALALPRLPVFADVPIVEMEISPQLPLYSVANLLNLAVDIRFLRVEKFSKGFRLADISLVLGKDGLKDVGKEDMAQQVTLSISRVLVVFKQPAAKLHVKQEFLEIPRVFEQTFLCPLPVPSTAQRFQSASLLERECARCRHPDL